MNRLRSRAGTLLLLLSILGAAFATAGVLPTRVPQRGAQVINDNLIDRFISPRLSPQEHYIMHQAMRGLAPWQMEYVVLVDYVHGRIYANRPELLQYAQFLRPIFGHPGLYATRSGEIVTGPPHLAPPVRQTRGFVAPLTFTPPPTSKTGPFVRWYNNGTSWIAINTRPDVYPEPYPTCCGYTAGQICNTFQFSGGDSGFMYAGGYADTNTTTVSEAEAGVFIHTISSGNGFEPFIDVYGGPKFTPAPVVIENALHYGCYWLGNTGGNPTLSFSVMSSTELAASFFAGPDPRQGTPSSPPPPHTVTMLATVPESWGWNTAGTNELTDIVTSIAQPSPGSKGYDLDGSHITMREDEEFGATNSTGIGTYPSGEITACQIYPPGFATPWGTCPGLNPVSYNISPIVNYFPSSNVIYAPVVGEFDGWLIDICLANLSCLPPSPTPTPAPPTPTPTPTHTPRPSPTPTKTGGGQG